MTLPLYLTHRPAVHQLCLGAFIQETLHLSNNVVAIPFPPLGSETEAAYTAHYSREVLEAPVDEPAVDHLCAQGSRAHPVIAIVVRQAIDASPELLEASAVQLLEKARSILSWVSGDVITPFAMVTATLSGTFFRLVPPQSRQRQRLGFGNDGPEYQALLARLLKCVEQDEHFAFALSMFRDALREEMPTFRAARFFSCLESLAYRVKAGRGSRAAVRYLLGLEDGALATFTEDGKQYSYDRVEIAGRIRDKLFHGVPFDPAELNVGSRKGYALLQNLPHGIGDLLLADCEIEFARWANGVSRGLSETNRSPRVATNPEANDAQC